MEQMQTLIDQMVLDLTQQAARLDKVRLQSFLEYLQSHSSRVKAVIADHDEGLFNGPLRNGLQQWFASLSLPELLWEYRHLLAEIHWWQNVDPRTLATTSGDDVQKV